MQIQRTEYSYNTFQLREKSATDLSKYSKENTGNLKWFVFCVFNSAFDFE